MIAPGWQNFREGEPLLRRTHLAIQQVEGMIQAQRILGKCAEPDRASWGALMHPFLALCARARLTEFHCHLLRQAAARIVDWEDLVARAEMQGIGPLVYTHVQAAGIDVPPAARLSLQGLYLRHRHAAGVRTQVLGEILAACQGQNIPILTLKGAALAYLVYPQPGLRPMRDLDLLVRPMDLERTRHVLDQLRFVDPPYRLPGDHHHLTAMSRTVDGLLVSVEVHHALLSDPRRGEPARLDDLIDAALAFDLPAAGGSVTARTLGREDMLWHIYRHGFGASLSYEPFRLIWAADMVSLVEACVDEIDWALVRRRYRQVWNTLPLFHFLTPWSDDVLDKLSLNVKRMPGGVGESFKGWPVFSLAAQKEKGTWGVLCDTFFPSEWWTYLHYGAGGMASRLCCRLITHPLHLLPWVWRYLSDRVVGSKN